MSEFVDLLKFNVRTMWLNRSWSIRWRIFLQMVEFILQVVWMRMQMAEIMFENWIICFYILLWGFFEKILMGR